MSNAGNANNQNEASESFASARAGAKRHSRFANGQTWAFVGKFCDREGFKKLSSTRPCLRWLSGHVVIDKKSECDGTRS